jgi:hypothetical protein
MSSESSEAAAAIIASLAEKRKLTHQRRQAARESSAMFRAEKTERRQWGLKARHQAKITRNLATD